MDHAVGRQNHKAVGVHVDEGHHHGRLRVRRVGQLADVGFGPGLGGVGVFFGVRESCLVAVVPVGDDELFVGHGGREEADHRRIVHTPDAMQDAVLVGDLRVRGSVAVEEDLLHAGGGI